MYIVQGTRYEVRGTRYIGTYSTMYIVQGTMYIVELYSSTCTMYTYVVLFTSYPCTIPTPLSSRSLYLDRFSRAPLVFCDCMEECEMRI